jgi:predicted nucleotidyltransferase
MHKVRADRPVDPITKSILRQFNAVSQELGLDYFLVGATARDILLLHVFGIDPRRATRDVDLAIAIPDWKAFDNVKARLLTQSSNWSPSTSPQGLLYREHGAAFATPVDLVPFGKLENPQNTIAWPPDMAVIMNVAGYAEALQSAAQVQIDDDLVIRVASLPGLAILKIFAWVDRGAADRKDAYDLLAILKNYSETDNLDRLYADEQILFESYGYDPELAGAGLLGKDVVALANGETRAELIAILNDEVTFNRLVQHTSSSLFGGESNRKIFQAFRDQLIS